MQKLSIRVTITVSLLFSTFVHSGKVEAHRSGCHRWHSCPSDTGSYICGDLGYTSECPTNADSSSSSSRAISAYNRYMQLGYKAIANKDYQTALSNFKNALNQQPGDYGALEGIRNVKSYIQQEK